MIELFHQEAFHFNLPVNESYMPAKNKLGCYMINTNSLLIRELIPEDWQEVQNIALDFQKSEYAIYDMPLPVRDEEIKAVTKQFAKSH